LIGALNTVRRAFNVNRKVDEIKNELFVIMSADKLLH